MSLIERDLKHIWHPCSQMKDFNTIPPVIVSHAKGSYLYTNKGALIDANSSWWCKSLGHGHPLVIEAIQKQLAQFEHVIGANTTHPALVELGEVLAERTGLQHAFFASDGSSAVEIAMKLAMHAHVNLGCAHKKEFIALGNGYHGETFATMAVSDLGIFKKPYDSVTVNCHFIPSIPYVTGIDDPLWANCEPYWTPCEIFLNSICEKVCALILEPIVQGAGGMKIYSADFLTRLSKWAKSKNIFIIADEIMTGCLRTGKWLACNHAKIQPDIICLSKGLTSGTIPFSCVMIDHTLYEIFYDDYEKGKSFMHSHTYTGNALGASAALATLQVMEKENIEKQVKFLSNTMHKAMIEIAKLCKKLTNIRHIGGIIAADLITTQNRLGYQVYGHALESGALLRPLGNTIYWLPPLNIDEKIIGKLAEITLHSINEAYLNTGHE